MKNEMIVLASIVFVVLLIFTVTFYLPNRQTFVTHTDIVINKFTEVFIGFTTYHILLNNSGIKQIHKELYFTINIGDNYTWIETVWKW